MNLPGLGRAHLIALAPKHLNICMVVQMIPAEWALDYDRIGHSAGRPARNRECHHGGVADSRRFPLRFSPVNRVLFRCFLVPPSSAYLDLGGEGLRVRMGWAFSARIPRRLVAKAGPGKPPFIRFTAGAHWWGRGRWLVNGAPDGIVDIELSEPVRAFVIIPIRLKVLSVSLEDPEGFLTALGVPPR